MSVYWRFAIGPSLVNFSGYNSSRNLTQPPSVRLEAVSLVRLGKPD
jgi:hypothetical protein